MRAPRLIAVILAVAAGDCGPRLVAPPPPSLASRLLDAALPAFRRPTLGGGVFDTAGAGGHIVVVDFFADYCQPCHRLLPALQALRQAHADVVVVGVSLDADEAAAHRVVARHRLAFPVVQDSGNTIAGRYRVSELPITFVADGTGVIRWVGGPGQPEDALERVVAALANAKSTGEEHR